MKVLGFINELQSHGRYSFTVSEAEKAFQLTKVATLNALHRLKQKKQIVSPAKGFYLIVPPEYQAFGCLPADMFISDLMKYLNMPYYVGFLSAAQFYGAAHQKPQRFQVVTSKNRAPIQCGRIYIEFIAKKNILQFPTKKFNTPTGTIEVATPEVVAADLVTAPQHSAGINNVATVLQDLVESIDSQKLVILTEINPQLFWVQRLGYLLDFLGFNKIANELVLTLAHKKLYWVRLVSSIPYRSLELNSKWKIIVNTAVEPDE